MKIGDYVRTKKGISRITFIDDEIEREIVYTDTKEVFEYYTDNKGKEIKDYWEKYSPNIIDLIEVGDYVNGKEITTIRPVDICGDEKLDYQHIYYGRLNEIYKEEIKSIVTKEQFESMEYKVVE